VGHDSLLEPFPYPAASGMGEERCFGAPQHVRQYIVVTDGTVGHHHDGKHVFRHQPCQAQVQVCFLRLSQASVTHLHPQLQQHLEVLLRPDVQEQELLLHFEAT
jgi:hypothetical protein